MPSSWGNFPCGKFFASRKVSETTPSIWRCPSAIEVIILFELNPPEGAPYLSRGDYWQLSNLSKTTFLPEGAAYFRLGSIIFDRSFISLIFPISSLRCPQLWGFSYHDIPPGGVFLLSFSSSVIELKSWLFHLSYHGRPYLFSIWTLPLHDSILTCN